MKMLSLSTLALIGIGGFLVLFLWAVAIYNKLVRYRQQAAEGWSGIDVQLKRRANLIPNLVETVKGYASHEKSTLEAVTESRARCTDAVRGAVPERGAAEGLLSQALVGLFAVVEDYPDLKADESFLGLQKSLSEIEDNIQMARRYYNGTVRILNIAVESFPDVLIARQFRFERAEYFQIEDSHDRQVPGVAL